MSRMSSGKVKIVSNEDTESTGAAWSETISRHKHANTWKSCWQVANSIPPFFACWYLAYLGSFVSWWLTLLLAVPTAGFLLRVFIIQHDCGHHSFFHGQRANDGLGFVCGVLTCTPYHFWRRTHSRHHVTSGNLSHRGLGDVGTLTVNEYLALSPWGRLRYRAYRHPLFMFVVGSTYAFLIRQRFAGNVPKSWKRERRSVHATNLAMLAVLALAWRTIGLGDVLARGNSGDYPRRRGR